MKRIGWLISKYLIRTIVPYFAFSWLLLSVILFVQQASRYADIFFSVNVPTNLVWQLTIALIPNVVAFTCPMAMLVGVIIGLAKMQSDSELVAIRASGVGNLQIAVPIMVLGILLSGFAFLVNLQGVPAAAALVRSIALQTAIKKLESPFEPGVFNTEVGGYTIYIKGGDIETGRWKNIFIYSEDAANGNVRLITSQGGRIDVTGEFSELVLEKALVSTLPIKPGQGKYISESVGDVRFALKTKRSDMIEKLRSAEMMPEELGLTQLADYAASADGKERIEAQIIWQRRILLSITPLIFCILGTVMILRFNRGGRGFGIALALAILTGFYLLAFMGEQLARTGTITAFIGSLFPVLASLLIVLWFSFSRKINFWRGISEHLRHTFDGLRAAPDKIQMRNLFVDITTGLRDFDILRNLLTYFLLTLSFLAVIFIIFTVFELWKYAGTTDGGVVMLVKYIIYLLPFIYLQIVPSAAMIAVLATYVIKSRQNEIVTWTSAGQSVYRLLVPCFVLMIILGGVDWFMQERVLPWTNQRQDTTRDLLRNRGVMPAQPDKYWVGNNERIYSFKLPKSPASDNEIGDTSCSAGCVTDLSVYEFDTKGNQLQSVYRAKNAAWRQGKVVFFGAVEKDTMREGKIDTETLNGGELAETADPLSNLHTKPSHLNTDDIKREIAATDSDLEHRNLTMALEKKYTTLFLPFVMALFAAPFALSLSRKGHAVMVGYAIGLWLLFAGTSNIFEQLGLNGLLSPPLAVWSPLVIFSMFGIYLISKIRT